MHDRSYLILAAAAWLLGTGCIDAQDPAPPRPNTGGAGGASTSSNASGGGTVVPPGNVRIATWNLRTFPLTQNTIQTLVPIIGSNLQPDVLALQEITSESALQNLANQLPDYDYLIDEDDFGDLRLGMLYRRDRVTITGTETWFPTNGRAFPRAPFVVSLDVAGFDLRAVVLHLKAKDTPDDRERRSQAIAELANRLNVLTASGDEKDYVLLGDFNDELTDNASDNVFGPLLDAPGSFTFLTEAIEQSNGYTYIPFRSMLDHIMITADALDEYGPGGQTNVIAIETQVPFYEDQVSDHRPVVADFEVETLSQ